MLYLPDVAARLGPTASYLLIVGFWALGLAAIVIWSARRGVQGARKPLGAVSAVPARPRPAVAYLQEES
jgi:hypothetical protein